MSKRREDSIRTIESLFPADSQYEETAQTGKELLFQAICERWRALPDAILSEYASLCEDEEMIHD